MVLCCMTRLGTGPEFCGSELPDTLTGGYHGPIVVSLDYLILIDLQQHGILGCAFAKFPPAPDGQMGRTIFHLRLRVTQQYDCNSYGSFDSVRVSRLRGSPATLRAETCMGF